MSHRRLLALLTLLGALVVGAAGCGLGQGPSAGPTSLRVTRDFGAVRVVDTTPRTRPDDTALGLLQRGAHVASPRGWSLYVNGIRATRADVRVRQGDRVWWDEHESPAIVPAVVGSFPAPFTGGTSDKRLPIRVECTLPAASTCRAARQRFSDLGLTAAQGGLQGSQLAETTRVLVGTYDQLQVDETAALLGGGPEASGVYALMGADGRTLQTLDPRGDAVRTLGPGTGLVAAVELPGAAQVAWVITGTDRAGLEAAIRAVGERGLAGRFAVAVRGSRVIGLPEVPVR